MPGVFGRFDLLEELDWGVFLAAGFGGTGTAVFGGSSLLEGTVGKGVGLLGKVDLACFGVLVELVGFAFSGAGLLVLVEGLVSLRLFFLAGFVSATVLVVFILFCFFLVTVSGGVGGGFVIRGRGFLFGRGFFG